MTHISRPLLVAMLLVAGARVGGAQAADPSPDAIVEKHLAALGGREALSALTSRTMTGTITLTTPVGDVTGSIEILSAAPNKSRTLTELDLSSLGAGQAVIDQRFDGSAGYVLDSLQGDREITGGQLESLRNSAFPTAFLNYKERGVTIATDGTAKVGDRQAYVLVVTPRTGAAVRVFIDRESYLPLRLVQTIDVPQMGPLEQTAEYQDYRSVDGVKVPFTIRSSSPVQTYTVTVTTVTHNTAIDDALFRRPPASK